MGKFNDSWIAWKAVMTELGTVDKRSTLKPKLENKLKALFDKMIAAIFDDQNWDQRDQAAFDEQRVIDDEK